MVLTVDIGNTTVGISAVERTDRGGYGVAFTGKLSTERERQSYHAPLRRLLEDAGICPEHVEGTVLSSVVPCLDGPISRAVADLTGKLPLRIGPECSGGLSFGIPHPELLGLDRIADAAWAAKAYPLPAVTVDMGTATTFNVLDRAGVFLGGLIAPGLETGILALSTRTARLPEVELCHPQRLIGQDTEECMRSGAVAGTAAMVDGIAARIEAELKEPVTLVLTGGWARLVAPLCLHPHVCDPHLLPKGLAFLYDCTLSSTRGAAPGPRLLFLERKSRQKEL